VLWFIHKQSLSLAAITSSADWGRAQAPSSQRYSKSSSTPPPTSPALAYPNSGWSLIAKDYFKMKL